MSALMSGLFRKLPSFTPLIYGGRVVVRMPGAPRSLFLTFDDGPHPDATPQVLEILQKYKVKATFFILGKNVESHPGFVQKLKEEGHSIGNHTYSHLNGWKTPSSAYYADIARCQSLVSARLFRPPYGRILPGQARHLSRQFSIILWTLLSQDFITDLSPEYVFRQLVAVHFRGGEIIVFHDSAKASPRMLYALPRFVEVMLEKGFTFEPIAREH